MSTTINITVLKNARQEKGYSHRDMAKFLNTKSSATYYNIEIGKS